MLLRHAIIENFRGIRRLEIDLGATTVLIGENASGKSSLLELLRLTLGLGQPPGQVLFGARDFDQETNAPIRAVLEVAERERGRWTAVLRQSLQSSVVMEHGLAVLRLEVRAEPNQAGRPAQVSIACLDSTGRPLRQANPHVALEMVRRRLPFLTLADSLGAGGEALHERGDPAITACLTGFGELSQQEFRQCQQISRRLMDDLRHALLTRGARDLAPARIPGSGAQSLAPLLLFGNLLRHHAIEFLDPEAIPILGLTEIEAHLHPSVLSAMWGIVQALPIQKVVTTYSGELLSLVPLELMRRMERRNGEVKVFQLREGVLTNDERRRVAYHIRARRGAALFARCWLLVEGETEAWLMPELARALGYDLTSESVACIEFAQSGPTAIVRLANELGIEWHLLADGDRAGRAYAQSVRFHLAGRPERECITELPESDLEHHLWYSGFDEVFRRAAGQVRVPGVSRPVGEATRVIEKAIERNSKPWLALQVIEALQSETAPPVPPILAQCIQTVVRLARSQDTFEPEAA